MTKDPKDSISKQVELFPISRWASYNLEALPEHRKAFTHLFFFWKSRSLPDLSLTKKVGREEEEIAKNLIPLVHSLFVFPFARASEASGGSAEGGEKRE